MKTREVTCENIQDAALVGQIVAESDLAKSNVICAVDDDDCCGHKLVEHCVAEALEVSEVAVWLWLTISNAISTPLHERAEHIAMVSGPVQRRRVKRLYAWVDLVGDPRGSPAPRRHPATRLESHPVVLAPWALADSQAARRWAIWRR